VLGEAAALLLGEDQLPVYEHVELARCALGRLGLMLGRLVYLGRETRSPAVIAVSDGAVVDLDLHGRTSVSCAPVNTESHDIVLIHGMWMTPRSWDRWVEHYGNRGHSATAPAWPGVKDPEETRNDPSPLKGLGLQKIVDHYDGIVRGLDSLPIIIGHSFGGLVTQLLLNRGLGAAGVAIGTAPPKGIILLPPSTLRAGIPGLKNPFARNGLATLSPNQFRWRFTNTLSQEESDGIYLKHYIPGTNRAFFEAAFAGLSRNSPAAVDYGKSDRAPLLLQVGGKDHISPPALNMKLLKLYGKSSARTESKEYPERTHFTAGMDGWEQVADDALSWATA
jgi:pimeloyl-ACP methyl ester carboxylesterase